MQKRADEYLSRLKVIVDHIRDSKERATYLGTHDREAMSGDFSLEMAMCEDELGRKSSALPVYKQALEHYRAAIEAFFSIGQRDSPALKKCQRRYEQCSARVRELEAWSAAHGASEELTDAMLRRMPLAPGYTYKPSAASIGAGGSGAGAVPGAGAGAGPRAGAASGSGRKGAGGGWDGGQLVLTTPFGLHAGDAGESKGGGSSPAPAGGVAAGGTSPGNGGLTPLGGQATAGLSPGELALVRIATINGKSYPLWDEDSVRREQFSFQGGAFEDPDGLLDLSTKQRSNLRGWERPTAFLRGTPKMIEQVSPFTIQQDLVGDCSFVSSLCVAAQYERRFERKLVTSIVYPQDRGGNPLFNPSGKYVVRLHVNGMPRRVTVDDRLPMGKSGKLLCARSNNLSELWVSIIEKAFLKLCGSYAFPGSNSCKDLYALTGWIPEFLRATESDFNPDRQWQRISGGMDVGDCLCTASTPKLSKEEEERWGLVETHAYAVLETREVKADGRTYRMVKMKNPWGRKRWKGKYSDGDRSHWTPALKAALHYDQLQAMQFDNGIFWIDWESMLQHFPSIYLSWNPSLLGHRAVRHGAWPIAAPGPRIDQYQVGQNPQFRLSVRVPGSSAGGSSGKASSAILWLLMIRHVTTMEVDDEEEEEDDDDGLGGGGAGRRGGGPATGSGAADPAAGGRAAAPDPGEKDCMALHVYGKPSSIESKSVERSSGGRGHSTLKAFGAAHGKQGASVVEESADGDADFGGDGGGVRAGERVFLSTHSLIRGTYYDSPYVLTKMQVPPGDHLFTLVVSQYRRMRDVAYSLMAFCSSPVSLDPVPDNFPLFRSLRSEWTVSTAGGNSTYAGFLDNPQFALRVRGKCDLMLRLTYSKDVSAQVRLLANGGRRILSGHQLTEAERVCDSGPYRPCFTYALVRGLLPGAYTVLASTFKPGQVCPMDLQAAASASAGELALAALPPEGTGMKTKIIKPGIWRMSDGTAAGCANHGKYERNPRFLLTVPPSVPQGGALVWAKLLTRPDKGSSSMASSRSSTGAGSSAGSSMWPAINVSVYKAPEQMLASSQAGPGGRAAGSVDLPRGTLVIRSAESTSSDGVYIATPHGVVSKPVRLGPGSYVLVASTFDPWEGRFTLRCYSDTDVSLDPC